MVGAIEDPVRVHRKHSSDVDAKPLVVLPVSLSLREQVLDIVCPPQNFIFRLERDA